jgi:hypothetical protein
VSLKIEGTLKSNPSRAVLLGTDPRFAGGKVVCKRFLHHGLLGRLRARSRARREHEMLSSLHLAGVRVPRPLALERCEGGWEVRMEWIEGARSLALHLADPASEGERPHLLRELGRLLAAAHLSGLDHPDLHLGNILVDGEGSPWLVDLHSARLCGPLTFERVEEDLLDAAASLREHLSADLRRRMLVAWFRTLPPSHLPDLPDLRLLATRIEAPARSRRLAVVERGQGRWLRRSGICETGEEQGNRILRRRDLPPTFPERARFPEKGRGNDRSILLVEGVSPRDLRGLWLAAARAFEHHLPTVAPGCLVLGEENWAAFTLPPDARRAAGAEGAIGECTEQELGRALGLLHDRGLDPSSLASSDVCGRDPRGLVLRPLPRLAPFDPRPAGVDAGRRFRAVLDRNASMGASIGAFREGYLSAFAAQPAERRALERELQ